MNYEQFKELIQTDALKFLPEEFQTATVNLLQVRKNNNAVLDSVSILKEGETVAPQIYLEELFAEYEKGTAMDEILHTIADICMQKRNVDFGELGTLISSYDMVKEHLLLRVVNKIANSEFLLEVPHRDIENTDLTAIFHVQVNSPQEDNIGSFCVKQAMFTAWKTDMDAAYQQALQNTIEQRPLMISSMKEMLFQFDGGEAKAVEDISKFEIAPYEQYVLCNTTNMYGASAILYPDVLQKLSENANANLFILPSSIHELILMQDTGEISAEELQAMVTSINSSVVEPQEVLSNEVYYYDKDAHSLSMATEKEKTVELLQRLEDTADSMPMPVEELERE